MPFGHDFFQLHIAPLVGEWRAHRNLDAPQATVVITTKLGQQFTLDGIRVAPTWIAAFTEDDEMWLLPFEEISNVVVRRRQGEPPKKQIGFRVDDPIDGGGA